MRGDRPAQRTSTLSHSIISAVVEGSPAVVTFLAIVAAVVLGGLLIAFSDPVVLSAWGVFFSDPWNAIAQVWDSASAAYLAMFEGAILNPQTVSATFHGGSVTAIFYPLSQTASDATPLILTGLSVAIAFRAGLFNIGAAGQWVGGAIVATYLGFGVSLPPVLHLIVCLLGGFAGGAVIGWLVGELKARTGAHEVIVTIMLNYIMYNLLSFLLSTPTALQQPGQSNLISPSLAANARLPHVGGPPPQVDLGFLVGIAAAAGVWWLLSRSTIGFQFRAVGANPNAARSSGMDVERSWVLVMLLAGGLAGLGGAAVIMGPLQQLTFNSYGTYGFDGITVALLGRARPVGVVLAALLFGALHAGGTNMEAATQVPSDIVEVLQGLIVLFVAAPPLIRAIFRLRQARAGGPRGGPEGVEPVTTMAAATGAPISINRRMIAAGTFILFGLIDIFVFGLFAHPGDAVFVLTVSGGSPLSVHVPAAPVAYVLGSLSLAIGLFRAVTDPGKLVKRLAIAAVLLFFVISLLCWAYAGSAIPLNVVNLLQSTLNLSIPLVLGALAGCMCERSGVINIAIEGQLLLGAFTAAVVASAFGGLWFGLITGSMAGGLLGLVLAVFAISFLVDQIILGVVLNVLASGLTGYLYDRVLVSHPDLNSGSPSAPSRSRCSAISRSSGRSSSTRRSSSTSCTP